jgi:OOP family OmpA-OmpF porin
VTIKLLIEFDTDKADVKAQYNDELKKVAEFLAQYPGTRAEIEGHTDNAGAADYNKGLSQRRADAVRAALVERFHVDASRLSSAGYGEERPVAGNDTAEGRAQNRRVVAVFRSK